ncbi:Flp pilus assembly protein TadG [Shimia thalassica]|uniref:Flp pilus assembly protein TadG n=1 Tax=Shimia thalassica TaxID=1715693 RepID=A0A0P1IG06_9RHOB|nr:TadE/TadG family type IV pilus assembly protein [Shimia thalassica]CUJ91761.1 Flp pilus assembly protein TadG [Shimia thalassica]
MMHLAKTRFTRFVRKEDGHASLEFAIMFPIFFVVMLSAIELGMMTLRSAYLERALDIAVREVRLSTGNPPDHAELIQMICDESSMIPDCETNLKLEMIQVNPRAWSTISDTVTCTNRAEEVDPVTTFVAGSENELMILRACAKIEVLYPNIGFGNLVQKDDAGDAALVAMSAFVQEPQ